MNEEKVEELYDKLCEKLEYGLTERQQGMYDVVEWLVNDPEEDAPECY